MKEKFLAFIEKRWRAILIGIALMYIGLGLFQMLTGIELDSSKMRSAETVLMVLALALFFYGKRKEKEKIEREKADQQEEENEAIIEEDINNDKK